MDQSILRTSRSIKEIDGDPFRTSQNVSPYPATDPFRLLIYHPYEEPNQWRLEWDLHWIGSRTWWDTCKRQLTRHAI